MQRKLKSRLKQFERQEMKQRLAGFAAARARMMQRSVPELIELLASADLRTRFLAEMCLRDATST